MADNAEPLNHSELAALEKLAINAIQQMRAVAYRPPPPLPKDHPFTIGTRVRVLGHPEIPRAPTPHRSTIGTVVHSDGNPAKANYIWVRFVLPFEDTSGKTWERKAHENHYNHLELGYLIDELEIIPT